MKPLDIPKLVKIMAIANDPNSPAGERQAARARAEAIVTAAGYAASDTDALARTAPRSFEASNPFSAFDDEMEKREPGYKAKRAAEQAERLRKRSEERARIIRTYGSKEAARAPTALEKMVLQAVHPFIRVKKWREGRESGEYETLLGWTAHDFFKECLPRVQKAIENGNSDADKCCGGMGGTFFLGTARGRAGPCGRRNKSAVFSRLVLGGCVCAPTKHHPRSGGAQTARSEYYGNPNPP